jgi:hypothetical protein
MPSADGILAGLSETANTWRSLAVTWHLLLSALLVAFVAGCRLSTRPIALVAIGSVLTVSALSWVSDNPFNGIVFAALATALIGAVTRSRAATIQFASPGVLSLVQRWWYSAGRIRSSCRRSPGQSTRMPRRSASSRANPDEIPRDERARNPACLT